MRVLQVAGSYPPLTGGMEFHVQHLAEALAARGHQVRVITAPVAGEPAEEERNGVLVRRVDLARLAVRGPRAVGGPYDVLHAHAGRSPYSSIALLRGGGGARVFTPHCYYPAFSMAGRLKRLAFDPLLGSPALRSADRVIALTQGGVEDGVALGGARDRFRVVPNAVDLEENASIVASATTPSEPYPDRYLLFSGRVDQNKHVDFLVDATPGLLDLGLHLVVVGPDDGALDLVRRRASMHAVTDAVQIRGRVSRAELLWAVSHAEVVALPSRYEGLPTSLLEAAALGVPVVGSATGGTPYLLDALESGFAFPFDDHAAFLQAVRAALTAPREARRRTAEYVGEHYSWSRVVDQVLGVYAEVC